MQAFLGMAIIKNSRGLMMVWGVEVFSHKEHFMADEGSYMQDAVDIVDITLF